MINLIEDNSNCCADLLVHLRKEFRSDNPRFLNIPQREYQTWEDNYVSEQLKDLRSRTFDELSAFRMTKNPNRKKKATLELLKRYRNPDNPYEYRREAGRKLDFSEFRMGRELVRPQLLDSTVQRVVGDFEKEEGNVIHAYDPDMQIKGHSENFRELLEKKFYDNPSLGIVHTEQKGNAFISKPALRTVVALKDKLPAPIARLNNYYSLYNALTRGQNYESGLIDTVWFQKR